MSARRAAGFGLVEMIVSLMLGVLVTLVASGMLVEANASYVHHAESARLNDGGRYALAGIAGAVRQAAFVNWDDRDAPSAVLPDAGASIAGLDAASVSRNSDGIDNPRPSDANGSDVLAIRYAGSGAGDGDGSILNCAGFGVGAASSEAQRGWSIFYVAVGGDGAAELRCKYKGENGWGADAIVRGVDTFQVLYGVDTDTPADGVPNAYLNATAIKQMDAALPLEGEDEAARGRDHNRKTWWKRVASIQVALLLHGERHSRFDGAALKYDLFGAAYTDAAQGRDPGVHIDEDRLPREDRQRARRVFTTTIVLRNAGGA
ncbi:PilW family protein [Pseudoduganella namucuonensis]|uniref:Type IV pilus assembly protein PilW n=1 Tax=Pseudoduganella namucuonensis TaxID=1035707 RepID=A0A1I7KW56_9BURK|nr:PilW family protein [Pseudoduganella namucuonensis]SFV01556.1 type IV pilus assembly protein PilW [Pseudoduganella namucuonensis]